MKGNESKILIGSVVIAVLIILAAYKFFYSEDMAKIDQTQTEINGLNARLAELNEKNANRAMYEAAISDSNDIIKQVLSLYGPGNTPEKTIMMFVDLCRKTGCSISDIAFEDNSLVYSSDVTEEGQEPKIQIFKTGTSVTISSGYTQFKKINDYINSYIERMNAESFDVNFDPTSGRLNVTMKLNLYSVKDENHEYVAPVIENIDLGTENIFKTYEIIEEETEEGAEEGTAKETSNTENNTSEE